VAYVKLVLEPDKEKQFLISGSGLSDFRFGELSHAARRKFGTEFCIRAAALLRAAGYADAKAFDNGGVLCGGEPVEIVAAPAAPVDIPATTPMDAREYASLPAATFLKPNGAYWLNQTLRYRVDVYLQSLKEGQARRAREAEL